MAFEDQSSCNSETAAPSRSWLPLARTALSALKLTRMKDGENLPRRGMSAKDEVPASGSHVLNGGAARSEFVE